MSAGVEQVVSTLAGLRQQKWEGGPFASSIWSIDKDSSMRLYLNLGARAIITNKPGALRRVLQEPQFRHIPLATPGYMP